MSKYISLGLCVGVLVLFTYLSGKLYIVQQSLIKCKFANTSLEAHLSNQNSEIIKYKAQSDKSILNQSEIQISNKYNSIKGKYDSCQSVIDTYLNLIKE